MNTTFQQYLFADSDESDRLLLAYKVDRSNFEEVIEHILDSYGLAERLAEAKSRGQRLQMLDVGCNEGLFLHELARLLEKRDLLAAADLTGIDSNSSAIATAEDFCQVSRPPRPYLHFYWHDATQPFEENAALRGFGKLRFDFIYATSVLEFLPQARQQLAHLWQYLNPGGVIYLRSMVTKPGRPGWQSFHPAIEPISQMLYARLAGVNGGLDVASETAGWLRELGAEQVEQLVDEIETTGRTERGKMAIRNLLLVVLNSESYLVQNKLLSRAEFQAIIGQVHREVNINSTGYAACINTIARKPQL